LRETVGIIPAKRPYDREVKCSCHPAPEARLRSSLAVHVGGPTQWLVMPPDRVHPRALICRCRPQDREALWIRQVKFATAQSHVYWGALAGARDAGMMGSAYGEPRLRSAVELRLLGCGLRRSTHDQYSLCQPTPSSWSCISQRSLEVYLYCQAFSLPLHRYPSFNTSPSQPANGQGGLPNTRFYASHPLNEHWRRS
jgi:hypothetical protein